MPSTKRPPESPSHAAGGVQNPAKRLKSDYNDTVTILSGSEETKYTVHEDVICAKSGFFKAACSRSWKEGQEGIIKLPTIDASTCKLYVHWAYTGEVDLRTLPNIVQEEAKGILSGNRAREQATLQLCKLHVAADLFLDTTLKNRAMDSMLQMMDRGHWTKSPEMIKYVWANTGAGSHLKECILNRSVGAMSSPRWLRQYSSDLGCEIILDFAVKGAEVAGMPKENYVPTYSKRCSYHEHAKGEKCE